MNRLINLIAALVTIVAGVVAIFVFLTGYADFRQLMLKDDTSIKGAWSDVEAEEIILNQLNNNLSDFDDWKDEQLSHYIYPAYLIKYPLHDAYVVVSSSKPANGFDCHSCLAKLSFFEFEKRNGEWALSGKKINALDAGGWGAHPASEDIKVEAIGPSFFGVFITWGGTYQGITQWGTQLYANLGGNYHQILDMKLGLQTIEPQFIHLNFDTKFKIIKHVNSPFYDISFERSGSKSVFSDELPKKGLYKFNGQVYSLQEE